uniref:Uncharacterized protein n=1 Tax=Leptocylindrus danicus TaxID=163516 RepID=A0A7S2KVT6_9STRA
MYAGVQPSYHALERSYESEKPLAYPQQLYIECTPECSHSIMPLIDYKNVEELAYPRQRYIECTLECSHLIMPLRDRTKVKNHWLILNSDTSNARRSAAIQSCP